MIVEVPYVTVSAPAPTTPAYLPPAAPTAESGSYYPAVMEGLSQGHKSMATLWFALIWILATLSFQLCCPLEYEPAGWHVPWWLMPWLPSVAIGLLTFR